MPDWTAAQQLDGGPVGSKTRAQSWLSHACFLARNEVLLDNPDINMVVMFLPIGFISCV